MNKFRKWLIRKLEGIVQDDWVPFHSDYWERQRISCTLYVPSECYTDAAKDGIERELAENLGKELLRRDLILFSRNSIPDNGDVPITGYVNALGLKKRMPYHMPNHLQREGDEAMNVQKTSI